MFLFMLLKNGFFHPPYYLMRSVTNRIPIDPVETAVGIEAETMDEFEGHQEAGAAAVVGLDRPVGARDGAGNGAVVAVVNRRGERAGRIVSGMVTGLILRMTMGVNKVVITGSGDGNGLI